MARSNVKQASAQDRQTNKATPYACPAPTGGLNARDAQANMPETDALVADNIVCQPTYVEFRGGHTSLAKFTGLCETIAAYNGLATNPFKMFAAVNNAGTRSIYRVDNAGGSTVSVADVGGAGATIQAITSTQYDAFQFGTGSGDYLILLNGTDNPLIYDGTTWQAITSVSAPFAWTGGPTPLSSLRFGAVYKQRIWMIQAGTFNLYYLPQNVVGGALTLVNLGPNFKLGGYLVTIITVSIDNSNGSQDYIAFVSNQGEIVQFTGFDPASVNTFSVSAHYRVGRPIGVGRNCWQKIGEDAMLISADGAVMLSEAMLTDRSQERNTVSDKIRLLINQAIGLYGSNYGWQLMLYPFGNKLFVNVPTVASGAGSFTFVMNTLNGSWSTWGFLNSPLNAMCWEQAIDNIYYGTNGSVEEADLPAIGDNGAAITASIKPAFNYMGERTKQKRFTLCQPIFKTSGALQVAITLTVDFDGSIPTGSIPLSTAGNSVWNVSLWNTPTFWGDAQQIVKRWLGLQGAGYCAAPYMQFSYLGITGQWQSITYLFEEGGTFYGK